VNIETRQPTATLIQHMGTDLTIVNAARVSFNSESNELNEKDKKLIRFLKMNRHDSVFEHCSATFLIECDLAIAMQIVRHRTFAYNMVSRRYTKEGMWFYIPEKFRRQSENNKQASDGVLGEKETKRLMKVFTLGYGLCYALYGYALKLGLCREQARYLLPVGSGTKFYMTGNLRNFMHFIELRDKADAQGEVQWIAASMKEQLNEYFPNAIQAFKDFQEKQK